MRNIESRSAHSEMAPTTTVAAARRWVTFSCLAGEKKSKSEGGEEEEKKWHNKNLISAHRKQQNGGREEEEIHFPERATVLLPASMTVEKTRMDFANFLRSLYRVTRRYFKEEKMAKPGKTVENSSLFAAFCFAGWLGRRKCRERRRRRRRNKKVLAKKRRRRRRH